MIIQLLKSEWYKILKLFRRVSLPFIADLQPTLHKKHMACSKFLFIFSLFGCRMLCNLFALGGKAKKNRFSRSTFSQFLLVCVRVYGKSWAARSLNMMLRLCTSLVALKPNANSNVFSCGSLS